MAYIRSSPEPQLINALRKAIVARFGQPINDYTACERLVLEMERQLPLRRGRGRSTVLRFFGLAAADSQPTRYTLDTFAQYAGYLDFETFARAQPGSAAPSIGVDRATLLGTSYADTLQRGYMLGRMLRPDNFCEPASPQALALAADPVGQEFVVESMVDLAHLNGAYGQMVEEYLQHNFSSQAQIFGYSVLFLRAFLANDEPAWRARLTQLLGVRVPPYLHPFPRGRRASAILFAAWFDAGKQHIPADVLAQVRQAAPKGNWSVEAEELPQFYNHFPAGYHFLVMETLFLTRQYAALADWLALTKQQFPELQQYQNNIYLELMQAFEAVARLHLHAEGAAELNLERRTVDAETHQWLWDYYQVHWWLAELHFALKAADAVQVQELSKQISSFAAAHRMPFFAFSAQQMVK